MLADTLRHLKLDQLTDAERKRLRNALERSKRSLEAAIEKIDQQLKSLGRKKAARRKTKR
jgi:hypothetical protein